MKWNLINGSIIVYSKIPKTGFYFFPLSKYLKIYYLQEYVNHNSRDVRVFIVGGEAVAAMYRYTIPGDWRSNATIGGKTEACRITGEIEEMALKAAEATHGEIVGVDLLEGDGIFLLKEVNHNPGFQHIASVTKVDIAEKIIDYLKHKASK